MQPSDTFVGTRLWWVALIFLSPLLTAMPLGGHSLHLARARGPLGRVSTFVIASDRARVPRSDLEDRQLINDHSLKDRLLIKDRGLKTHLLTKDHSLKDRLLMKDRGLKNRLFMDQYSRKKTLFLPASVKRDVHAQVQPLAGQTDSSVVFAAVFCSLIGTVLIVLLLVFGFVVWREAYEVSERKRRLRNTLPAVEESAYAAYPRDDSPSNFPPVFSSSAFGEKGLVPHDVADFNTHPAIHYPPPPVALAYSDHSDHGYRRGRSILSMNRRRPKKVVRLQVPLASPEPSLGKRYTQYDVTGIELSDAQKRHRMEGSRRVHRY